MHHLPKLSIPGSVKKRSENAALWKGWGRAGFA